jgi:hypothetical protein
VITSLIKAAFAILSLQTAPAARAPAPPELPKPVVLYEEGLDAVGLAALTELGAQRYFVVYQNNADTGAQKTGVIDPSKVARYVVETKGDTPEGWGVLDFENPFDNMLQKDPTSEQSKAAIKSMVETIRVMKRAFPRVRWTYYGMPGLKYYLPDGDWSKASARTKTAEVEHQLAAYGPVLSECDWLAPCVYYTVGDARGSKTASLEVREATRAWIAERTAMCVRFAAKRGHPVPVIPFASPLYMPGGGARAFSVIPSEVMEEDVLLPVLKGGAAGLCIWTGASTFIGIATDARPGDTMTEGGGKSALIKTWAEDLSVDPTELRGEGGRELLTRMISQAQVSMASAARRRWNVPAGPPTAVPSP